MTVPSSSTFKISRPGSIVPSAFLRSTNRTTLPSDNALFNSDSKSGAPGNDLAFNSLSAASSIAKRS